MLTEHELALAIEAGKRKMSRVGGAKRERPDPQVVSLAQRHGLTQELAQEALARKSTSCDLCAAERVRLQYDHPPGTPMPHLHRGWVCASCNCWLRDNETRAHTALAYLRREAVLPAVDSGSRIRIFLDDRRVTGLRCNHGLSVEQAIAALRCQPSACDFCHKSVMFSRLRYDTPKGVPKPHPLRGWLCSSCVAWFRDHAEKIPTAVVYLDRDLRLA